MNHVSHIQGVPSSKRAVEPVKSYSASCISEVPVHVYLAIRSPVIFSGSFGLSCKSDGVNRAVLGLICILIGYSSCISHSSLRPVDDASVDSTIHGLFSYVDAVVVASRKVGSVVV